VTSPQEFQICIAYVEEGLGLVTDMHQINKYGMEEDLPDLCKHCVVYHEAVWTCDKKGEEKNTMQYYRDPNSPWVNTSLRWVTHSLVRFYKHEFDSTAKEH
jgi:hypothetical protein